MKNEEALKALQEIKESAKSVLAQGLAKGCEGYYKWRIELSDVAIAALESVKKPNRPLTLEELRKIENQPVWVKLIGQTGIRCEGWCEIEVREQYTPYEHAVIFWPGSEVEDIGRVETYGETWVVLSYQPEQIKREPCERCKPADFPPDRCAHSFHVVDSEIYYYDTEEGWEGEEIKFCPWCGRPLTPEEGVES